MDMFKEAEAIDGMIKMFSLSQNECAKRLGTSQSYVANKLRLLKIGGKIREEILCFFVNNTIHRKRENI